MTNKNYYRAKKNQKYKKTKGYKSLDAKITKIQKAIEWKHKDTLYNLSPSSTSTLINLTAIGVGDADNQRDGDKITCSSFQVNARLNQGDTPYNKVRITFVRVPTNHWSTFSKDHVFNSSHSTDPALWMYNLDSFRSSKLKVCFDKVYTIRNGDDQLQSGTRTIKLKIPFKYNVQFVGGSTACNYALYGIIASDSQLGPHPTCTMYTRLHYCDI